VNLEKNLELTVAFGDKQLDAFGFCPSQCIVNQNCKPTKSIRCCKVVTQNAKSQTKANATPRKNMKFNIQADGAAK